MSRVYELPFRIASVAAAKTLMYVTAGTYPVRVKRAWIVQESGTSELLSAGIGRITTLGTPTATTVTALIPAAGPPTAGFTAKANVTASEPTYGASAAGSAMVNWYGVQGFQSGVGWYWFDDVDGGGITIAAGDTYGLYLFSTPTTGLALSLGMVVDELFG